MVESTPENANIKTQSSNFWDPEALLDEERRQLDVCHGCRLCWNLCPAFPKLFDLTDSVEGDFSKLNQDNFDHVESLCFQCKLCWVVCPYTEPHEYDLDVPSLFQRSKFQRIKKHGTSFQDKLLADQDRLGQAFRVVAPVVNLINQSSMARQAMSLVSDIHKHAPLPKYFTQTFEKWFQGKFADSIAYPANDPVKKVAFFTSCTVNYNAPEIGKSAVEVLLRNNVQVLLPEQVCCGMPMIETGDISGTERKMSYNISRLKELVDQGYDIVTPSPTCALTLRKQYAQYSTDTASSEKITANTYEFSHYLVEMARQKILDRNFTRGLGTVSAHVACHSRAQAVGNNSARLLGLLPDTKVKVIEECSGHDGTWGSKKQYHELSLQVGSKLFNNLRENQSEIIVSDCPLAAMQIEYAIGSRPIHIAQALSAAYGLGE